MRTIYDTCLILAVLLCASLANAQSIICTVIAEAPPPARSVTPPVSAPALMTVGYDASRPYTEWAADFAPLGYGEYGKVISRRYVDAPAQSAPVQFASYTPTQTFQAAPVSYQASPAYMPSYQPSYAPAQYASDPVCYGGNCATCSQGYASPSYFGGGSVCGPGGCSSCANGRCR